MVRSGLRVAAWAAATLAFPLSGPAAAECALEPGESLGVIDVIDGDTVVLADHSEVRLVGLQAPKLPLGRKGFEVWPLAPQAREALIELALDHEVELRYGGEREDRHGRRLAHLFVVAGGGAEPVWVQGAMLEAGLARTYTFPDNRSCAAEMLAIERAARAAGRGIWADPYYDIRDAGDVAGLEALTDTFQIVEGVVEDVAAVNDRVYLNFGHNYREDFTVTIDRGDVRRFGDGGEALRQLEGKRIRVRGWLALVNGPMIEASHPEQIELGDSVVNEP